MKRSFLLGVMLIALLIVPFANAVADNNVPRTINYTGNLFDYSGQPINKAVDLNVKIYNSQTGGTALWTEDHRNVQVEYGYFSVNLGTESPLNLDFKSQYWVELAVNGNSYARVPFTSTPYAFQTLRAFRADTADVAKEVVDKSITLESLADETRVVTGDVYGTYPELYIKDGVIVSKIGKGQITNYHISESVSLPPAGPAGGALTGQYPDPKLAENAVETFNIMDGSITYPKLRNAVGPIGTILAWNGTAWVESTVNAWEVDGVIGNEVIWATNGLEILTDEDGLLGVGIVYGGVTNDMLAGDITTDKLVGDISLDLLADGNLPGQVWWWNNIAQEWVLTPNAPHENYVMKWIFNHDAGQAQLEWAEDNMSIPFYYSGASIDPNSTAPNLYSKTMFELVLDGARGVSDNSVHGIAVTINDTEAGSAMVLTGSGMDEGNMLPVAIITAKPYVGSASYEKGILDISASVGTLADLPSYGALINQTVTGTNHGITSTGAGIYNTVGDNRVNGLITGLDVMSMSNSGDNSGKVVGGNFMANGTGSDIATGVVGTSINAKYNAGVFGAVNNGSTPWTTVKSNLPSGITNIGVIAYGPVSANTLALYAYGNSQFDGNIIVRDDATVNGVGTFNGTLNTTGNFQLGGVQGAVNEILIGQGDGVTPVWSSVADLMEDLTDGAGIADFTYDGSETMKVVADIDGTSIIFSDDTDEAVMMVNMDNPNEWTATQTFASLIATDATIENLTATNGTITTLTATTFVIDSLTATTGYIATLTSDDATITNLTATTGTIDDLTATIGYIATLTSDDATITNLTATTAVIDDLTATTGYIATLTSDDATITNLTATTGYIATLTSDDATITNLTATTAVIDSLTATTVDINGGNIDGTIIGATTPAVGTFTTGNFTTMNTVTGNVTGLLTAATVDLNGGNIDNTVIGAAIPAAGTFTTGNFTTMNTVTGNVTGLLTATTVDINGGNIDGTIIGATTPAVGTFTTGNFTTMNTVTGNVTGLLTADSVDINGGTIENTVIGATTSVAATFTDATVTGLLTAATGTIDDLTVNTIYVNTSLTLDDAAPLFASNGSGTPSEGNIGDLFVSRGAGLSPEWTTSIPLLDVTELSTNHLVVNDPTPGMEPIFEVPVNGNREAWFGTAQNNQGVDVTIFGTLTANTLEVFEPVDFLEVRYLDVLEDLNVLGTFFAAKIDADLVTTDRLHVNLDAYLTNVEAHGLGKFYDGLSVTGGNLVIAEPFDIIAGHNLIVNNAINNPTSSLGIQEPVLVDDAEGLNVPNGPVQAKRLVLGVADITDITALPTAKAGIINYSDTDNIAQINLPTAALNGEVLYIANTSAGTVTILGTPVSTQNMIVLVYLNLNWIVMP